MQLHDKLLSIGSRLKPYRPTYALYLALAFVVSPLIARAEVQKNLMGFQNLPWGTKFAAVKAKFPELKIDDVCRGEAEIREIAKKTNTGCLQLFQNSYSVSGIDFRLSYNFDHSDRLIEVSLGYIANEGMYGKKNVVKQCQDDFENLKTLLEVRYGTSYGVNNPQPRTSFKTSDHLAWLPLPTQIVLSKSFGFFDKADDTRCGVEVRYAPRRSAEADKL